MNDQYDIKFNPDEFLKYNSVEEYLNYLRSQLNLIKEQPVKKLKLTEVSILSEII